MKFSGCILATALAKSITQVLDDLTLASTRLFAMTTEQNDGFSPNPAILEEILKYQTDVMSVENTDAALKKTLAVAANLNLEIILSAFIPEGSLERGESSGPANKFTLYGCYCSPHHDQMKDGLWLGKGTPVDDIDNACKNLWSGYKCLRNDYGDTCDNSRIYNWQLKDGKPACVDKKSTCLGDLCRLDLEFVEYLNGVSHLWNPDYHLDYGFDRFKVCGGDSNNNSSQKPEKYNGMKEGKCCGKGLKRHTYNPEKLECCKNGSTKPFGSC